MIVQQDRLLDTVQLFPECRNSVIQLAVGIDCILCDLLVEYAARIDAGCPRLRHYHPMEPQPSAPVLQ
jgi:hypothetical protein